MQQSLTEPKYGTSKPERSIRHLDSQESDAFSNIVWDDHFSSANASHQPTATKCGVCAIMAKPCAKSRAELWVG